WDWPLWVVCDTHPWNSVWGLKSWTRFFGGDAGNRQRWYAHWVAEGLAAAETLLNRHRRGAFFAGAAAGIVECCLVPQLANARRMGCDLAPYPALLELEGRCLALEAFQRASPERQPDYLPD
ncbi:maleylacetoacetate isomerase, partial [Pseudomonas aeruginosa]